MSLHFQCFINGDLIELDEFDEDWSLSHFLRNKVNLTGTKIGCGTGGCGSCTVIVSKIDVHTKVVRHFTINACITPIYSVHGCHILTVEGLTTDLKETRLHPIQHAIARGNGTQCGFCTPGMVMSAVGLEIEKGREASTSDIKNALQGNLCRCTGYRPILEALQKCSVKCNKRCNDAVCDIEDQQMCPETGTQGKSLNIEGIRGVYPRSVNDARMQEIEKLLKSNHKRAKGQDVEFVGAGIVWLKPRSGSDLSQLLEDYPEAKIVSGCTSESLQTAPGTLAAHSGDIDSVLIDITAVQELRQVNLTETHLSIGAAFTISEVAVEIRKLITDLPEERSRSLKAVLQMIKTFGSTQIRNQATIGGSMSLKSKGSDIQTMACYGITSTYLNLDTEAEAGSKIISSVNIPLSNENEQYWFHKVSRRKTFDSAILNIAAKSVEKEDTVELKISLGGVAINPISLIFNVPKDETQWFTDGLLSSIQRDVESKVSSSIVDSQFSSAFIKALAKSLISKYSKWMGGDKTFEDDTPEDFKASQVFHLEDDAVPSSHDLVHKPVPHASAYKHTTGEAKFCDDVPAFSNELELAFVLSNRAHAKIVSIDFSRALEVEGVVGYVSHEDLSPEKNKFGLVEKDEEIFASSKVICCGQIVAGIVAKERQIAQKASKLVSIEYEDVSPVILTNEDAIQHNSYYTNHGMTLERGDCENSFQKSPHVISGEVKIGSQEHFYMEPQGCIVIPKGEDTELEIISSTQNPTGVQMEVSNVLEIPANRVVVKVKRVGGGFGGKESRCMMVAVPTAIAAVKFGKPVRCILDRETDMLITGKRHPFLTRHKIAFDENGILEALKMSIYVNAGHSLDVSMAPVERVLLNLDNAYRLNNIDLEGFACKTNIPSNTVFRGTGAPQAAFLIENIMDVIASTLEKDPAQVKEANMYREGDVTPYGQPLINSTVRKCWDACLKQSNYYARKLEIAEFNKNNVDRKLGISMNPCHFGIGYTALHLNQGAALVHIYTDGSVLISHSGVEIGQGVHTKIIQVATRELGIPASKIRILETSTDKVPNSTASSASVTSDMNGMAVLNACRTLVERLQPYWTENPDANWEDLVSKAYMDRVSLSATGFYKVPDMGWDNKTKNGSPWNYFSSGAACSVVEIDCLTGAYKILQTDIVMDVGQSLNPSIDIGQIEGAFTQGVGLFTIEELITNNRGELETCGPATYKIPTVGETPAEFNVSLLTESSNPKAIYSSKTVGEPPLLLATSVFFALKDAIRSHRVSKGKSSVFDMDSPASIDKIFMACQA